MKFLLDTNILIHYLRKDKTSKLIESKYNLFNSDSFPALSIVTVGEIHSLALQLKWGETRKYELDLFLKQFVNILKKVLNFVF
jgi:tRNA(fMet)-specific endonuclease VapC